MDLGRTFGNETKKYNCKHCIDWISSLVYHIFQWLSTCFNVELACDESTLSHEVKIWSFHFNIYFLILQNGYEGIFWNDLPSVLFGKRSFRKSGCISACHARTRYKDYQIVDYLDRLALQRTFFNFILIFCINGTLDYGRKIHSLDLLSIVRIWVLYVHEFIQWLCLNYVT